MAETNPAPPPPGAPRSPRWMRILLVASLGLNLLIVAMVSAAVLSGGGPGPSREAARDLGRTAFIRALGPGDRRALWRDMRSERGAFRENREQLRARFERLLVALRAEEFDRAALDQIIAEQRAAGEARRSLGERLVVRRLEAMSVEDRRAYADRLEAEVTRRRRQ